MDLDGLRREFADAVAAGAHARGQAARMRPAREAAARRCLDALGLPPSDQPIDAAIRQASQATDPAARRGCAVVLLHALAVPGLVPSGSIGDVCLLMEGTLRSALLRSGYPFGGTPGQKLDVLERLHARIDALMEPLEPTFPNWIQGLHAG